ncbi:Cell wall-binding protein YocH precursor [compost metagenome]
MEIADEPAETWRSFTATAYVALCDTGCTGITRAGYDVRETQYYEGYRVVATDPGVIPLGTRFTVRLADGYEFAAIALDSGGAIKGAKIDVLVADLDAAWEFGRQAVEVKITGREAEEETE